MSRASDRWLQLTDAQLEAIASCIIALRLLPADQRMDAVVVLCKMLTELNLNDQFFPDEEHQR